MAIEQAFAALRERIKPAVLDQKSIANGQIMRAYLESKGYDFQSADDETLANFLYEACVAETARLKWLVKPAKLKLLDEKVRTLSTAHHEVEEFAERVKKAEAAKEYQKAQDAAKKQVDQFIENIMFVDGLRGVVDHSKTGKVKGACKTHLKNGIAEKRDLTQVATEIRNFVAGEHEKAEKALERL